MKTQKFKKFLKVEWDWLRVSQNRRNLYSSIRLAGPALIATGLFTPKAFSYSLDIAAAILLVGGTTVAKRNVK